MTIKQTGRLLIAAFKEWNQDKAPCMAAALAYYTVFSLAPLLLLVIAIAGIFLGQEAAQGQILRQFQGLLGEEGAKAIQAAIENVSQSRGGFLASAISILALLFGASGVFVQLQTALNSAWAVKAKTWILGLRPQSFPLFFNDFLFVVSLVLDGISHPTIAD